MPLTIMNNNFSLGTRDSLGIDKLGERCFGMASIRSWTVRVRWYHGYLSRGY